MDLRSDGANRIIYYDVSTDLCDLRALLNHRLVLETLERIVRVLLIVLSRSLKVKPVTDYPDNILLKKIKDLGEEKIHVDTKLNTQATNIHLINL